MSSNTVLDLYVVSWGGVGTSAIMRLLKNYGLNINSSIDKDNIKHINSPKHNKLENIKIKKAIFIYDDVINSILSLWRRNYQYSQVIKLTDGQHHIQKSKNSLTKYCNDNIDLFKFETFFNNWINIKKNYPCIFVRGTNIYKYKYHILKFLDLPENIKYDIKYYERNVNWKNNEKNENIIKLKKMYGKFNDFINRLPDIMFQNNNSTEIFSTQLINLSRIHNIALLDADNYYHGTTYQVEQTIIDSSILHAASAVFNEKSNKDDTET
jgi:hypothetical protein